MAKLQITVEVPDDYTDWDGDPRTIAHSIASWYDQLTRVIEARWVDAPVRVVDDVRDRVIGRVLSGDWFASVGDDNMVYPNKWVPVFHHSTGLVERRFDKVPEDITPEELEVLHRIQRGVSRRGD